MRIITYLVFIFSFLSCEEQVVSQNVTSVNQPTSGIPSEGMKFLALGDSYTIGQSVSPDYRWPNILRDSLEERGKVFDKPEIIAKTGWRTDQLLTTSIQKALESDYSLVSLLIGVNNQYQGGSIDTYKIEFEKLLNFAIDRAGGAAKRVLVLSIPDYGCTPFGASRAEQIAREIDLYNSIAKSISQEYGITFISITEASREAKNNSDLIARDDLHPSGLQYVRWVDEILKNEDFIDDL